MVIHLKTEKQPKTNEEKIYTVPLRKAYNYIRTKRTRRAVAILQQFVVKHSKVTLNNVKISNALNSALWKRSMQKPPHKIKIKVLIDADIAKVYLVDEQIKKQEPKTIIEEKKSETILGKKVVIAENNTTKEIKTSPEEKKPETKV